jgi:hypothetical protein
MDICWVLDTNFGRIPAGHLGTHKVLVEKVNVLGPMATAVNLTVRTDKVTVEAIVLRKNGPVLQTHVDLGIQVFHVEIVLRNLNLNGWKMWIANLICNGTHAKKVHDMFYNKRCDFVFCYF